MNEVGPCTSFSFVQTGLRRAQHLCIAQTSFGAPLAYEIRPGKKIVKRERVTFSEKRKGWTVQSTDEIVSWPSVHSCRKRHIFIQKEEIPLKNLHRIKYEEVKNDEPINT